MVKNCNVYITIIICVQLSVLPRCKWLLSLYGVWWNTWQFHQLLASFSIPQWLREENHGHRYWTI